MKLLNEQLTREIRQFLWVVCCSLEVQMKIFCTEEGYDSGQSPELFVNVTAVPFVSEILQVHEKNAIFFAIESNHKFLKVSDTAFSLTAAYYLGYYWQDKRISIKKGDYKYIPQGA